MLTTQQRTDGPVDNWSTLVTVFLALRRFIDRHGSSSARREGRHCDTSADRTQRGCHASRNASHRRRNRSRCGSVCRSGRDVTSPPCVRRRRRRVTRTGSGREDAARSPNQLSDITIERDHFRCHRGGPARTSRVDQGRRNCPTSLLPTRVERVSTRSPNCCRRGVSEWRRAYSAHRDTL
jgi:hypothetical protein